MLYFSKQHIGIIGFKIHSREVDLHVICMLDKRFDHVFNLLSVSLFTYCQGDYNKQNTVGTDMNYSSLLIPPWLGSRFVHILVVVFKTLDSHMLGKTF